MLNTRSFGRELQKLGFTFYSGVPCSYLKDLINYAINECDYVAAANEGDAVAIAAGAYLGGKKPVVLMQNSGLANAVSPLVSLNYPFRLPVLGFVSLRGEPGLPDEPQHELMGRITTQLLELMRVRWMYLSADLEEAKRQMLQASRHIDYNEPFFFIVKHGTFETEVLNRQELASRRNQVKVPKDRADQLPTRNEVLAAINRLKDDNTVQLATTGKTGRELYEIEDAPHNLYMVGSLGCVSSLGLGLALSNRDLDVVVIDGDGSLLMRMGSLATNGYYNPPNMLHILLDNQVHDSTGGQSTVSHNVDFVEIAASCGYEKSIYIHSINDLEKHIRDWKETRGLSFFHMNIQPGSRAQLGRPKMKPHEVKERLQLFIRSNSDTTEGEEHPCKP
ncbi:phosphonopyruvate decarboxylase [Alicyclobacillus dauci]|uniref:Phosphonopyruvate decarboxylase n=1 Tax=Alicyclobacillus dauci TaxID=1475485 RepID=A0ABY6Z1I3_9BACL|nr:phosphonopyruvate decarboxylase [Alicyclobacillus dauci]WAH36747.1 phosphonopyruvate decarboxylase [Alicyclobacillus dauci]